MRRLLFSHGWINACMLKVNIFKSPQHLLQTIECIYGNGGSIVAQAVPACTRGHLKFPGLSTKSMNKKTYLQPWLCNWSSTSTFFAFNLLLESLNVVLKNH